MSVQEDFHSDVPVTVGGADAFVASWVARQLDLTVEDFGPLAACGVMLDGALIAGIVYSDYRVMKQGSTMQGTIASISPRWATRRVLRDLFGYPFRQIGVSRFWASAARKHKRSRQMLERLGFKFEGIARRAHDGVQDAAVYSLLEHECMWIRGPAT